MGKRIAAVLFLVLLLLLCGCETEQGMSILCTQELLPSARALCTGDNGFSYSAAESDLAAVQQLESGNADCVLLTVPGYEALMEQYELELSWSGGMTQFLILSAAGEVVDWTSGTRVIVVGERGNYADFMAQQVLTCALYGTLHYEDEATAADALQSGKADVVMGFFAVQDEALGETLLSIEKLSLESIPESLVLLELPGDMVEKSTVRLGDKYAESVVVPGVLVFSEKTDETTKEALVSLLNGSVSQ